MDAGTAPGGSGEGGSEVTAPRPDLPDPDTHKLDALIAEILRDAFLAGSHAGARQIGDGAVLTSLLETSDIDWSAWKPGSPEAAQLVADGRLAELLADAGITVKGIIGTTLDRIGNAIADGIAAGDSVDSIAGMLSGVVGNLARAEMIAHTETARAMTASSLDVYATNGIGQFDLITSSGACPQCEDAAAANPHPLADTADAAPLHPLCRCAVSPVV